MQEGAPLIRLLTVEYPRRESAGSKASKVLARAGMGRAGKRHFFCLYCEYE